MSEAAAHPVMVGQTYRRLTGPALFCEVQAVHQPREGWAMCAMNGAERSYGLKPVPCALLRSDQFRLEAGPGYCLCGSEGPDEFGNYDQIEHPDCPIHGAAPIDPDAAEARLDSLLAKKAEEKA